MARGAHQMAKERVLASGLDNGSTGGRVSVGAGVAEDERASTDSVTTADGKTSGARAAGGRDVRSISPMGQAIRIGFVCVAVAAMMVYLYAPAREMMRRLECCDQLKSYRQGKADLADLRCPRSGKAYTLEADAEGLDPEDVPFVYVVVSEPLSYHGGAGGALLYSDGDVAFLSPAKYQRGLDASRKRLRAFRETQEASPP